MTYSIRIGAQDVFHILDYVQNVRPSNPEPSCWDYLQTIPNMIFQFVVHRYADFRMLIRSCCSMGWSLTQMDVNVRLAQLTSLKFALELNIPPIGVQALFNQISDDAKDLLFYADSSYVQEYVSTTDPERRETIRGEIIRECERARCLQENIYAVHHCFFSCFQACECEDESWGSFDDEGDDFMSSITQILRDPEVLSTLQEILGSNDAHQNQRRGGGGNVGRSARPREASNIGNDIPNTVPYNASSIPAEVRRKAARIDTLKSSNPSNTPGNFICPITQDIMSMPVFDASHPRAKELPQNRHPIDQSSLEGYLTSTDIPKCVTCRHPENGSMAHLRIDTGLQDQILSFLGGS